MAQNSAIEWTDATWNPVRGCTRISEGCRNCYAERTAYRFSKKGAAPYKGLVKITNKRPQWTGDVRLVPDMLDVPLKRRQPTKFFVNSMSDLFHEKVPFDFIDKIYAVIGVAKKHTFQILTKRPDRAFEYFESRSWQWAKEHFVGLPGFSADGVWVRRGIERAHNGVSVENQEAADQRMPIAVQWPIGAGVRWVSAEPLLGQVNLARWFFDLRGQGRQLINWVVVGGESGPLARPMHPDWARLLREQCKAAGIPFFFKQWGAWMPDDDRVIRVPYQFVSADGTTWNAFGDGRTRILRVGKKAAGRLLDGKEWNQYPEAK